MENVDPRGLMWIDPLTVKSFYESLTEEDAEMLLKTAESFGNAIVNAWDATLGKDAYPMVRICLLGGFSIAQQVQVLEEFGFEVDEDGIPVVLNDECDTTGEVDTSTSDVDLPEGD